MAAQVDLEAHLSQQDIYGMDKYPGGYPRYAALLSSHNTLQNFRKFTRLRMRLLLSKQDKIVLLEKRLDVLDQNENRVLYLGCMRIDQNSERLSVLEELEKALKGYDDLIAQTIRALSMADADQREVGGLRNWIDSTGCLDRDEGAYLDIEEDLGNLTGSNDTAVKYTESLVEDTVAWIDERFGQHLPKHRRNLYLMTPDQKVLLLGPILRGACRVLAVCAVAVMLLAPTFVLPKLTNLAARTATSVLSAVLILIAISFFTRARTVEIVAYGASYIAVLVAFTAATTNSVEVQVVGLKGNQTVHLAANSV